MAVVSVSLTEKNMEVLDHLVQVMGLKGRSEGIRACIRTMEDEIRKREEMTGDVEGVLIIVHDSHDSRNMDILRHRKQDLIATQIHSHLRRDRCLEVFIIRGEASDIKNLINAFKAEEGYEYVKFVQS
jgi:CopG family transcriptional regulator, nickel-responsive regulator